MRLVLVGCSIGIVALLAAPVGAQTLTTLVNFNFTNGGTPMAGLMVDLVGNLYGTTSTGGGNNKGTAFRLSDNGAGGYSLATLINFHSGIGSTPRAGLISDGAGNLFGTTQTGGTNNEGTVFRLSPNGSGGYTHTRLFNFNRTNGGEPWGLISDAVGNLYGTTFWGGANDVGTVFRLSNNGVGGYTHSILLNLNGTNGRNPYSGLISDADGNLFGTTLFGGPASKGNVFRLSNNGAGGYSQTTLLNLDGTNGQYPYGGLVSDSTGNFYGTAFSGGANGRGTVFRLSDNGAGGYTQTTLYSFDGANGQNPRAGLIADAVGNLFGTTERGGLNNYGTVFRLSDDGAGGYTHTTLFEFDNTHGAFPSASLVANAAGDLFGATPNGGTFGYGTVFRISDAGFVVSQEDALPTPEPASLVLFGVAIAGLAARQRPRPT